MALSCSGLSGQLSLIRLCGFCTNRITHGFYSRDVSYQSKLYLCRHFASSNIRPGVFKRYISPTLQRANAIYEGFLKRRFPKLYELHRISLEGCKLLFQDCRDVRQIKMKMVHGVKHDDLSYREMEKLREFRKNLIKVIPIMLICSPPFLNYLGILLMYFFPRQVLIPYFWTPRQQVEFRQVYHSLRAQHYEPVLKELQYTSQQVKNSPLQGHLKDLCAKVSPKL
ncbi:LETM1 domain-containing protein 1 [Nematolebias whitei]|uniref:LETM1 domain-containing protein 1 n=1 Tax=Nematolebias whitei TaxID=451745 RepID=UPI00189989B4|nr:LETM1 domain-containing protein 1 [Nematolebias whitei]